MADLAERIQEHLVRAPASITQHHDDALWLLREVRDRLLPSITQNRDGTYELTQKEADRK